MRITWTQRTTDWVYLALTLLYVGGILSLPLFPTQDGPQHLYYAVVQDAISQNPQAYGGEYVVGQSLPPYSFMTYFFMAAARVVSGAAAEKLLACLYVVLFCFGFRYLIRSVYGRTPIVALFVFPLVLHTLVYLGFYNHNIGLAVMFWTCGFWLRHWESLTGWKSIAFGAMILLHLATHPFPLLMAVVLISFHLLLVARHRPVRYLVRPILHLGVAVGAVVWVTFFLSSRGFAEWTIVYPSWTDRLIRMARLHALVPYESWLLWGAVTVSLLVAAIGALAVIGRRDASKPADETALLVLLSVGCGLGWLLAPSHVSAWAHLDERFPALSALFLLTAAGGWALSGRVKVATGFAGALIALLALSVNLQQSGKYARVLEPLLEAPVAKAGARGVIVTLDHDSAFPHDTRFSPCLWAPAHYFRRSQAILLNAVWLDLPQIQLSVKHPRRYHFKGPPTMLQYLTAGLSNTSQEVPDGLDLLIAIDCRESGGRMPDLRGLNARYSLQAASWSTPEFAASVASKQSGPAALERE
jgi:hypothetical protein